MRLLFIFAFIFLSSLQTYGQGSKFELSESRPNIPPQYIVLEFDSLTIPDGYNRILEWIKINYNTPSEVIKAQFENKYIRIEGVSGEYLAMGTYMPKDIKYMLEFRFQEDRIKLEVLSTKIWHNASQYTSAGWFDWEIVYSDLYKKNGKPRAYAVKGANSFLDIFNNIATAIKSYILEPIGKTDEDDW
jgi:hypothetical protein